VIIFSITVSSVTPENITLSDQKRNVQITDIMHYRNIQCMAGDNSFKYVKDHGDIIGYGVNKTAYYTYWYAQ
jgi:hypothetical protein